MTLLFLIWLATGTEPIELPTETGIEIRPEAPRPIGPMIQVEWVTERKRWET